MWGFSSRHSTLCSSNRCLKCSPTRRSSRPIAARVEDILRASVRDHPLIPDKQILDVRFHEFMDDEVTTVKRVNAFAEQPLTENTLQAVETFVPAHPRGKLDRIAYSLEDFGLDRSERRARPARLPGIFRCS